MSPYELYPSLSFSLLVPLHLSAFVFTFRPLTAEFSFFYWNSITDVSSFHMQRKKKYRNSISHKGNTEGEVAEGEEVDQEDERIKTAAGKRGDGRRNWLFIIPPATAWRGVSGLGPVNHKAAAGGRLTHDGWKVQHVCCLRSVFQSQTNDSAAAVPTLLRS